MTVEANASELKQGQLDEMMAHLRGPQNTVYISICSPELLDRKAVGLAVVLGRHSICALSEGNDGLGGDFPSKLPAEHAANLTALLMSVHAQGGELEVQKVLSKTLELRPALVETIAAVGDAIAHDQTGRIDPEKQTIAARFSETMKTVIPEGLTGKRATVVPEIVKRTVDTIAIHPKVAAVAATAFATVVTPVMNAAPAYAAPNNSKDTPAMVATEARSQQSDSQPENEKDVKDKEVDPSERSTNPVVNTLEPAQMENTNIPDAQKDINTADILVKASSIPDNTDKKNASNTSTATPSTKKEQTGGSKPVTSNQEEPSDKNNGNDIADEKREDSPTTPAAPKAEKPITDSVTAPVLNRPPASETPGSSGDKTSIPGNSGDIHDSGNQDTSTETPTKDTNVSHQPIVAPVQQIFDNVMAMVGGNGQGAIRSEEARQTSEGVKHASLDEVRSSQHSDEDKTVAEGIVGSTIVPVAQSLPGAGMPDVAASVVEGVVMSSPAPTKQGQVLEALPLAAAFDQINEGKTAGEIPNPSEVSIVDTLTTTPAPGTPAQSDGFDLSDFVSPAFKEIIESYKNETTPPEQTPAPTPPASETPESQTQVSSKSEEQIKEDEKNASNAAFKDRVKDLVKQSGTPVEADLIYSILSETDERYNHPVITRELLLSGTYQESLLGKLTEPSSAGARGWVQFMPKTWKAWGKGKDILDPWANVDAAFRYMIHIYDLNKQRFPDANQETLVRLTLAGYNAGPYNASVKKGLVPRNGETEKYVQRIMESYGKTDAYIESKKKEAKDSAQMPVVQPPVAAPAPVPTPPTAPEVPQQEQAPPAENENAKIAAELGVKLDNLEIAPYLKKGLSIPNELGITFSDAKEMAKYFGLDPDTVRKEDEAFVRTAGGSKKVSVYLVQISKEFARNDKKRHLNIRHAGAHIAFTKAAREKYGIDLRIGSSFRFNWEQIQFRKDANCKDGVVLCPNTGRGKPKQVALPGRSRHQTGYAVDYSIGMSILGWDWNKKLKPLAAEYGLVLGIGNGGKKGDEAWHAVPSPKYIEKAEANIF